MIVTFVRGSVEKNVFKTSHKREKNTLIKDNKNFKKYVLFLMQKRVRNVRSQRVLCATQLNTVHRN